MTPARRIIGIGASAGGVEALGDFFRNMPVPNGMAFVIILHLSPDRASMMANVLGRWTNMPVVEATDACPVQVEHVYIIPPRQIMTIHDSRLRLRPPVTSVRATTPIDIFFSALADDQGRRAVGIVLSGTGSDGALGLKAIKLCGGLSMAQGSNGTTPQYNGMPSSAIASGAVDLIVPVEAMPDRLMSLNARPEAPADDAMADAAPMLPPGSPEEVERAKQAICAVLRNHIGHNFNGYKQQTFMRRVNRRMQFLSLKLQEYVDYLRANPDETGLLFEDLLIGVTGLFRDADTFEALARVLPRLFEGTNADRTVRVWVPGCATGEEAYSLAILLYECMDTQPVRPKLQVFATDIDEAAIKVARAGRYPALLLKDVSPERIKRFFVAADGNYVVAKEIRDVCTFSAHSVIRDPPFSRIDMISCRNLLIYLDIELQSRVIPVFHYSLAPDGILLLGGSETVTRHGDLFMPIDHKHRIYQRRNTATPPLYVSPAPPTGRLSNFTGPRAKPDQQPDAVQIASERALSRFSPPFLVVNADGDVQYFSGQTGTYLAPPSGAPTRNLVAMARRGLQMELRIALRRAQETDEPVEKHDVRVETDAGVQPITLTVEHLLGHGRDALFMVTFGDPGGAPRQVPTSAATVSTTPRDATIDQLELRDGREKLQSLSEEYETALEELKSANEELHSVNEELQSSNEELETSKEEIQSMNEELQTINAQLSNKVEELDRTASDLRNLFESTQVATVFLDRFMIIRSFTPAIASIYNLIPTDQGRPLTDIVSQVEYPDVRTDVRHVLDTLEPFERRVSRHDGLLHYLMRILPYRESDNHVDGVIITFVDVTGIVEAERHHRLLVNEMDHRVRNMLTVVISVASQTLRRSRSLEEFSDAFLGRIHAMATAYTLLSREQWKSVSLRDVLDEELKPFVTQGSANVSITGPSLHLSPRGALAFGMVLHELATNAVKYGALSVPEGRLLIDWHVEESPGGKRFAWSWKEQNGPKVTPSTHRGFGMSVINRTLQHELKGEANLDFAPDGLQATVYLPFDPAVSEIGETEGGVT